MVYKEKNNNEDPIRSDAKWSEVKKLRVELMGGHFSKLPSLENVGLKPENDLEKLGGFRKTIDFRERPTGLQDLVLLLVK